MAKKGQNVFAAIHLGSEKISLKIVEYRSFDNIKTLEYAERWVRIGEETFKTGQVSLPMARELCELLNNYRRMMKEYGVSKHIVIGTTAMREALNRAFMIDQIYMATGLVVEVIDMPLEIYYKYISIAKTLKDSGLKMSDSTLFADISSGGLGITLVENGQIKYQQNIHIGVIRVKESFDKNQRSSNNFNSALTEYISSIVSPVHKHLEHFNVKRMVLTGTNTELLLRMLGLKEGKNKIITVPTERFSGLYKRVIDMKLAKIMQEFDFSEHVAETVLPTMIFYQQLIALSEVPELVFPADKFIDSLILLYVAKEKDHPWLEELEEELLGFVHNIGKYYQYDSAHAKRVAAFSCLIFDRLSKVHALDARAKLLLHTAAILHDIGKFVNLRQHYFFSYRLILSTDIFGLSEEEKRIVAYVAYHHAKDFFGSVNEGMLPVTRQQLSLVAKLAAILRLADALDRSYRQKINSCKITFKGEEMQMIVTAKKDISLERWTIEDKSVLFAEVFGIKPVLIEKNV